MARPDRLDADGLPEPAASALGRIGLRISAKLKARLKAHGVRPVVLTAAEIDLQNADTPERLAEDRAAVQAYLIDQGATESIEDIEALVVAITRAQFLELYCLLLEDDG